MIASTHLTAGAAVGALSYRFIFRSEQIFGMAGALILGVISHLVLDMIPHGDDELYRPGGSDYFLPLILSAEAVFSFLAIYRCGMDGLNLSNQNGYLLAGMTGGALPDVPHVLSIIFKVDWKVLQLADRLNLFFHTTVHAGSFWQGLLPQVIVLIFSLVVLYCFKPELTKVVP